MHPDLSRFSLAGKTILLAGASKGIGRALAEGFACAGAHVVGFGRSASPAQEAFDYQVCDATDAAQFAALLQKCVHTYGAIDGYFHVAGVTFPSTGVLQTAEEFDKTLRVNLYSAYACCAAVGQHMVPRKCGSIVTVTSIGSLLAFPSNPGYVASKGGLRMMSKAMAQDLGQHGIRVNSLVPGYIHTDMTDASYSDPEKYQQRAARTMLARWGQVDDLVGAAIFLASDASTYVTGTDLVVDGGWTAKGL